MKSTAILVALIGSSAVNAIELMESRPVTITSEVVMTRTVTITTFQAAEPTFSPLLEDRKVHRAKGSGRKAHSGGRPAASPLERMPGFHGAAKEVPEPSKRAINARAPMPMAAIPTMSASAKAGMPVVQNDTQGFAAAKPDMKSHNGTFHPLHRANHTANHGKGKSHNEMDHLKDWINRVEKTAANKVDEVESSVSSKAKNLFTEDAAPAS